MKRKTTKVTKATKTRARKPKAKAKLTLGDVVQAALREGVHINVETAPIQPRKVDVHYPEAWGEEIGLAAKVLGVEPVDVHAKLSALLPSHYPNHIRMLEAIVQAEQTTVPEEIQRWNDLEHEAYLTGRKLSEEKATRLVKLAEEIAERRKLLGMTKSGYTFEGVPLSMTGGFVVPCKS